MRLTFRRFVQRATHDVGALRRADLWETTRTRRVGLDSLEAMRGVPASPAPRLLSGYAHDRSDLLVLEPVRGKQDNRGTLGNTNRNTSSGFQSLKMRAF